MFNYNKKQTDTMTNAFKSLSTKSERKQSPNSIINPDTKENQSKQNKSIKKYSEKIQQKQQESPPSDKKEFRPKVYGAILRYKEPNTNEIYYALVQGRYTGKWSFPKGHSKKNEEPYDCVLREVMEETGIGNLPNPITENRIGFGYYYTFDVEVKYELSPKDATEIMNKGWMTLDEMNKLELNVDASYFKRMLLNQL